MIFWAFIMCPDATRPLMVFFWLSSKNTPTRDREVNPRMGSWRALPTRVVADRKFTCPPVEAARAAPRSTTLLVARSKIRFPLPVSFRIFVNVRRRFSPDWIALWSIPTFREIE
jgi:hypothetical protein